MHVGPQKDCRCHVFRRIHQCGVSKRKEDRFLRPAAALLLVVPVEIPTGALLLIVVRLYSVFAPETHPGSEDCDSIKWRIIRPTGQM